MGQSSALYYRICADFTYAAEDRLATSGTLGSLMNIWPEANYRADDQLFLGII